MRHLLVVFAFVLMAAVLAEALEDCPLSSQVTTCTPKCKEDLECSSVGGRCCRNICNAKSCVSAKAASTANNKYKGTGSSGGSGTYCGNVKCNAYEKCDLDKSTKRQKCVRA